MSITRFLREPLRLSEVSFPKEVRHLKADLDRFHPEPVAPYEVLQLLASIHQPPYREPAFFQPAKPLPEFRGRKLELRDALALAHAIKLAVNAERRRQIEDASPLEKPFVRLAWQFQSPRTDYVADMQALMENRLLYAKLHASLFGFTGKIISAKRAYAKTKYGWPERDFEDLAPAYPEDFVEQYLGHRPKNERGILTDQHRQWIKDHVIDQLAKLEKKLDALKANLAKHAAALEHSQDALFSPNAAPLSGPYADAMAKELRSRVAHAKRFAEAAANAHAAVSHARNP